MFSVQYSGIAERSGKFASCFTVLTSTEVQCVAAEITSGYVFDTVQEAEAGGRRAARIASETGNFPPLDSKF